MGNALDASFADELVQRLGDGGGPGGGALADLALGQRALCVLDRLHDALCGIGRGLAASVVRPRLLPGVEGRSVSVIDELQLDVAEAPGVAMLDRHDDLVVAPAQVQI